MSAVPAGRAYGGESAADRDERRRRQLLDAGSRVFGGDGYRTATVRGLCREAKVADRHFYRYFDRTEDLLLAVYGECILRLTAATADAITGTDSTDVNVVARAGLDAFFRVAEDPHLARVVWMEVLGVSTRVERTYLAAMHGFGVLMLGYLRDLDAFASPREDVDVDMLVTAAVGGISHTALTWYLSDYAAPRRTVVATTATFLAGIAGSLTRTGS